VRQFITNRLPRHRVCLRFSCPDTIVAHRPPSSQENHNANKMPGNGYCSSCFDRNLKSWKSHHTNDCRFKEQRERDMKRALRDDKQVGSSRRSPSPRRRAKSPGRRSKSPRERSKSPYHRSSRRRSESPRRRSNSPRAKKTCKQCEEHCPAPTPPTPPPPAPQQKEKTDADGAAAAAILQHIPKRVLMEYIAKIPDESSQDRKREESEGM